MHVSARTDYALRALLQLAARHPGAVTMGEVVSQQRLPRSFAETILPDLRRAGFVRVSRVGQPSYTLARPPDQISVGSVLRSVEGPLTRVRGLPPDRLDYTGAAADLGTLWLAASSALSEVVDAVTLDDLVSGRWSRESSA
jgi:Rrf2 family protein